MAALTKDDIARYLSTRDDFDLELFVYRSLGERGILATHGGAYVDPVTGKSRQYDVLASKQHSHMGSWQIALAIECKALSVEFPLIVSRVPRPETDSYHEVVESWGRAEMGERFARAKKAQYGRCLYRPNDLVAKKTSQLRWDEKRLQFGAGDSETYDKWSQALSSASGLVQHAIGAHTRWRQERYFTLILPALVVSDDAWWAVDYNVVGVRQDPTLVETAELYVDQEYCLLSDEKYRISHLHIYTKKGFLGFLDELLSPTPMGIWERGFRHTLR